MRRLGRELVYGLGLSTTSFFRLEEGGQVGTLACGVS